MLCAFQVIKRRKGSKWYYNVWALSSQGIVQETPELNQGDCLVEMLWSKYQHCHLTFSLSFCPEEYSGVFQRLLALTAVGISTVCLKYSVSVYKMVNNWDHYSFLKRTCILKTGSLRTIILASHWAYSRFFLHSHQAVLLICVSILESSAIHLGTTQEATFSYISSHSLLAAPSQVGRF